MDSVKKINKISTKERLAIEGGRPIRSKADFLRFGAPFIEKAEIEEVIESLKSGWLGTASKVCQFEKDFAAYKKCRFAIALNSCTAALHLSLLASGLGAGDEVITTPMTFCATVNAIIHCGAIPVLVDCNRKSMNIDAEEIKRKITSKTKAILVVHFAGRCCDMDPIMALAETHGFIVIEDCAHAIESEYHGQKAGCIGHLGCFSFAVTKSITTGEGGIVVTNNEQLASKIKILGSQGMDKDAWTRFSERKFKHYQIVNTGFKYNMMDLQAAIGIHQLKRVESQWEKRQVIWHRYNKNFTDLPCFLPLAPDPNTKHGYHLYTPFIDVDRLHKSRDWVLDAMIAENIGVGVHYNPIHLHPHFQKKFGWEKGQFPNAEWIGEKTLSLPFSPALIEKDINDIIKGFRRVLNSH